MINILVTGSSGQVGKELQELSPEFKDFNFVFTDIEELDIIDEEAVLALFKSGNFQYCINCAAYTAVDKAEEDSETAYQVNVTGTKNIAHAASLNGTHLFQLSTDYVYHNDQNTPFKESDTTNPQSIYARTKLFGDEIAAQHFPFSTIIRTSWVYSSYGHNFVKTMLRLGRERDQLGIVFDQIGTPTYAYDLARTILILINKVETGEVEKEQLGGIFHYSNEGVTSWYDFARAIFRIEEIECKVNPIETKDYPTPAKRPPFSVLNKAKIKAAFGVYIPHWEESLRECLQKISD